MAEQKPDNQQSEELIAVEYPRGVDYEWKLGRHISRFKIEARDNKKLMGNRCPKCNGLFMPPHVVCGKCKVRAGDELEEVSQKGSIRLFNPAVMRLWNPRTGDWYENPYPSATIHLDSDIFMGARLEETDMEKLYKGMRVEAVWREPKEERGQGMGDIMYFRKIEE